MNDDVRVYIACLPENIWKSVVNVSWFIGSNEYIPEYLACATRKSERCVNPEVVQSITIQHSRN